MRIRALILVAGLLLLGAGGAVRARPMAPEYSDSEPAAGSAVHKAPSEVVVRFSEPLDESSTLEVTDPCGDRADHGTTDVSMNEMTAGLHSDYAGKYEVTYVARGLGGVTGTNRGRFTFTVHSGPDCDGDKKGPGHGKGHGRHEPGKDPGHEGRDPGHEPGHDPDGDGHEGGSHTTSQHDGTTHVASGGTQGDGASHPDRHAGATGRGDHSRHDDKAGAGGGKDHDRHRITPADPNGSEHPPLASGRVPRALRPDEQTVLLALAICLGLGVAGGLVLRLGSTA